MISSSESESEGEMSHQNRVQKSARYQDTNRTSTATRRGLEEGHTSRSPFVASHTCTSSLSVKDGFTSLDATDAQLVTSKTPQTLVSASKAVTKGTGTRKIPQPLVSASKAVTKGTGTRKIPQPLVSASKAVTKGAGTRKTLQTVVGSSKTSFSGLESQSLLSQLLLPKTQNFSSVCSQSNPLSLPLKTSLEPTSKAIPISSSPPKDDSIFWIPALSLFQRDKVVI